MGDGSGRLGKSAADESAAGDEPVADQGPQRFEPITRANLLALGDSAGKIADRDFVNTASQTPQLGSHLGAEFETPAPQAELAEHTRAERLVGCSLVGNVCAIQEICRDRQNAVGNSIPSRHAGRSTQKPRSVNYICLAVDNWLEQFVVVAWIVLQIPVLDYDYVAGCYFDALAERRALTGILRRVVAQHESRLYLLADHLGGAIGRSVVHHNDLFRAAWGKGSLANPFQDPFESSEFVVNGNDDGHLHGRPKACCNIRAFARIAALAKGAGGLPKSIVYKLYWSDLS